MVMAPYPMLDSAVLPCFHDYLTFLHRHFQPQSPPSHPLNPSLHSQQQPSHWDCSSIPKLQLPATAPSRGSASLFVVCMAVARKDCLILIPFWLPQSWCFTLSLKCFSSDSDNCPDVGIRALLQFHHWLRAGPVLLILLFTPPSSIIPPSFAWLYIFFSTDQVLLSALGWCSACTYVSEGVFLTYPWREMYSMSTYPSAILFSLKEGYFNRGLCYWQKSRVSVNAEVINITY